MADSVSPKRSKEKTKKKSRRSRRLRRLRWLVAILLLLLLAGFAALRLFTAPKTASGGFGSSQELTETAPGAESGEKGVSQGTRETIKSIAQSSELMQQARALKATIRQLAAAFQKQDMDAVKEARQTMQQQAAEIRATLDKPFWRTASYVPGIRGELRNVNELLSILDAADEELIGPFLEEWERDPLKSLRAEGGVRVEPLMRYLDLFEELYPKAKTLYERLQAVDSSMIDLVVDFDKVRTSFDRGLAVGDALWEDLGAFRALLGDGGERVYLFAAQNSAEIRASGGFPGAIGFVRIRDGLLTVSDFQSVYSLFPQNTPDAADITPVESKIFAGRLSLSWDSDFSPDFERVASIWALSYRARSGVEVDGVISATPAVIPRLLSFLGSITLSDGTELNGENAGRYLGHDIYFKYLTQSSGTANARVDELFSECARKTLDLLLSQLELSHAQDYYQFFRRSFADRTMMVWMADETEEELMRQAGWSASLNTDPEAPEIGVFFNTTVASKTAWFLNIEPQLSDPVIGEDGALVYELSVTLSNVMTTEELYRAGPYILGGSSGVVGYFYVFAPAGGSILSMEANVDRQINYEVYEDLELGYLAGVSVYADRPITVTCQISTAPGVETIPVLVVTPTMQEFR